MACYLIAGASGYVGARLAERLLAAGERVRGLVRNPDAPVVEQLAARGMTVWIGDLTHPTSLVGIADGVDFVYNLTSRLVIENGSLQRTYVDGNQHLIAACSRSRTVQRYIFTSNVAPYGHCGATLVSEDTPVAPQHPLGEVMVAAEQTLLHAAREHHFPAIILRCASLYGPGRDPVQAVAAGLATIYGDGRNFVAHIHIEDLLAVLLALPAHGQPGAIYNIGDDQPLRALALYSEIRQRLGMVPPRTVAPAAALAAGIDPTIVGMLSASVRLDNRRMKHDLPITLRYPSLMAWLDERLPLVEACV
ncbi:MAG: NAD-dependent epimerase/dehydratase family protein [Candidatus Viridilinea halotolerans]|uniref:NAD-dependent epimerase/dehydratase family protein n=1 Tax=Candidatus Viridilinea halotolerans TaxID=2491704 RepID=A0A426TV90_9CHLR|nr:MAG: NAD-dependent epimerase/dehydratase family protein [Candidatus Viridilinea halotolerans]